jgi:tRNA(fMet)-specific endonuclease VapC
VKFLLDTNACIALINRNPPSVCARLDRALAADAELFVSAVAALEPWYGVAEGAHQETNARRVETFFAGPVRVLPFEDDDARRGGKIRAALQAGGQSIGAYDLLMAGQALRRNWTLITAHVRDFDRVKGLMWEDWGRR